MAEFEVLKAYTRADVLAELGVPDPGGGSWYTGYVQHDSEWFLFPTVGGAGRTGHDYPNRWVGTRLEWFGKSNAKVDQPAIRAMTCDGSRVHLFARENSRNPFAYFGRVRALEIIDEIPVRIHWELVDEGGVDDLGHQEESQYPEGQIRQRISRRYERSAAARRRCLAHYGIKCYVCRMDFPSSYGGLGLGYMHVHHLDEVAARGREYLVDAIRDLRPVCPNCHAMLHTTSPAMTIEVLRSRLTLGG